MHFMDPKALAGLHVIGSRDVKLGIVEGVYADIRSGQPQWAAIREQAAPCCTGTLRQR
jgi:hypothetical protein